MFNKIIKEDLLHYVWKTKQFNQLSLKTTRGQNLSILNWGLHNHDAGPDFSFCQIEIDDTEWFGNIEMHTFSSEWYRHSHDCDPAFNSVILHVVYEEDEKILDENGNEIPCLELKNLIDKHILSNYSQLIKSDKNIPCSRLISRIDDLTISSWKDRLIAERLIRKSTSIKRTLEKTTYDWDKTFFITLVKYMGARVNTVPMEILASNLPYIIIKKNSDSVFTLESLLFGVAGFLKGELKDDYFKKLKKEYSYLEKKYRLTSMPVQTWKFAKMRPSGFPTIRISLLAHVIAKNTHLLNAFLDETNPSLIKEKLRVSASSYWNDHYRFGKLSGHNVVKQTTDSFLDTLLINAIAPFLFLYSIENDEAIYTERAIDLLTRLKPEKNSVIRYWTSIGVASPSAMDTQALLHLKEAYCYHKRCMSCNIGNKIVHM